MAAPASLTLTIDLLSLYIRNILNLNVSHCGLRDWLYVSEETPHHESLDGNISPIQSADANSIDVSMESTVEPTNHSASATPVLDLSKDFVDGDERLASVVFMQ